MNKYRKAKKKDYGLKAFFIYIYIVLIIVFFSLSVKSYLIFQENKYTGDNMVVSVSKNDKLVKIFGIDESRKSVSVLRVGDRSFTPETLGRELGILADGVVVASSDLSSESPRAILAKAMLSPGTVETDLTVFDLLRLLTMKVTDSSMEGDYEVGVGTDEGEIDKLATDLFSDSRMVEEGLSIQVVNSTSTPGLGQRLERVIENKGGTIISVINQQKTQKTSIINYYVDKSYTVERLEKLLHIPSVKSEAKAIADVVIIIGEDHKDTVRF
jgi:hypothetical protein